MARTRKPISSKPAAQSPKLSRKREAAPDTSDSSKRKRASLNLNWDEGFPGFTIVAPARKNKKQKTDEDATSKHDDRVIHDPFPEASLGDVYWQVEPAKYWESMQRYRRCTLQGDVFSVGQMVFVEQETEKETSKTDAAVSKWVAKILEIRAHDPMHVFLRVYWAYRPEDLPNGRQPYHGKDELIVSNHMDIIEALTVLDTAEVAYWNDELDESSLPKKDELFWRQSFDVTKPKKDQLSNLKTYCIDNAPIQPFEPLVQCPSCSIHLHASCIEDRAIQDAFKKYSNDQPGKKKPSPRRPGDLFDADLTREGSHFRLVLTDLRGGENRIQTPLDITCLKCGELIQAADGFAQSGIDPKTPMAQMEKEDDEQEEEGEEEIDTAVTVSPEITDRIKAAMSVDKTLTINPLDLSLHHVSPSNVLDQTTSHPKRGRGRSPKRNKTKTKKNEVRSKERSAATKSISNKVQVSQTSVLGQPHLVTPLPIPASEGILQSGARSVKRLLFR